MKINIEINIKSYDTKSGLLIADFTKPANSLVGNFSKMLGVHLAQTSIGGAVDIGGTTRNFAPYATSFSIIAAAGVVTRGIILGTGTNAVAIGDYVLQTPIAHGTGAGQLQYGINNVPASFTTSGSTTYFEWNRSFTNGSGGNITVNEVGVYCQWYAAYNVMMERTLNTFTINDGTSATYTYRFAITV